MSSKKETWKEFSEEIQSSYIKGGLFKSDKIESMFQNWKVTVDTYEFVVASPPICLIYSRIRAPLTTTSDFAFRISRKNIFDRISEKLVNSNIVTDDLQFDKNFVIKSNSENNAKKY